MQEKWTSFIEKLMKNSEDVQNKSIEALEKCPTLYMSYHLAIKNNLYKFESFYFDVFKYFDDMLVMRIKREEEFAPIKNKEGLDSPETALAIYEKANK